MLRVPNLSHLVHAASNPASAAATKLGLAKAKFVPPPNAPIAKEPEKPAPAVPLQRATERLPIHVPADRKDEPRPAKEKKEPKLRDDDDALDLDRSVRSVASMAPTIPIETSPPPKTVDVPSPSASIARVEEVQALSNALVEKAAFWGDGARGVARLRFGSNARSLSGATATLESDGERITLRIDGADEATTAKLAARLQAIGVDVES